jgi:small GTP-binding protein
MPDNFIVVFGSGAVGKSCICIQYIQGHFVDKYDATIEDTYRKPVTVDGQSTLLTIIDTAGQDAFGAMRETYMKRGNGFVLVYSITDSESFQQLKRIYAQLRRTKGDNADLASIVVGNKIDLAAQRAVSADEGRLFASQARCPFMEISAKNKVDVDLVFSTLVRRIRNENKTSDPPRAPPQGGMGSSGSSHSGNTQGAPTGTIGASGAQADAPSAGGAATGQPPSQLPRPKPKEKKWRCVML